MADYSGSFSGSFEGNGSLLRNINYYDLKNLPRTITTFEGNSILANNALRNNFIANVKTRLNAESVISSSAQLIDEFDIRYGNELGDNLVSGSSQVNFLGLAGIPNGLVSSSAQITITESQISDLTHTDVSSLNTFSGSIQSQVGSLTALTSSYLTELPLGVISSSAQITITESQISDLVHTIVPDGTISGSEQIIDVITD